MLHIADEVKKALEMLETAGYTAYLVGGCVRDSLIGRAFCDYDITTSALPNEIKCVFMGFRTIDTGIKHGTVTVIIDGLPIEITTYRIDGAYNDNRHPESVEFSRNLADDLCRRDFTMNAIAYNGQVVDLYGGVDDINNKIIRCVGCPDVRFKEDGLRVLRALRFSSVLGFEIEETTSNAIFDNTALLGNISAERICAEISKLLCGKYAGRVIKKYGGVFDSLFSFDGFSDRGDAVDKCPFDVCVRYAVFFLKDAEYKTKLRFLRLDNKTLNRVSSAVERYNEEDLPKTKIDIKMFIKTYGEQVLWDCFEISEAEGVDCKAAKLLFDEVHTNGECCTLSGLNINGKDLENLGLLGQDIGKWLDIALISVIYGEVENDKETLIEYIKERMK